MRVRVPLLVVGVVCLLPVHATAQYTLRASVTTSGGVTFTGNSLGLDGQTDENGQGSRGAIGTFITTDTTLQDANPSPLSVPLFPSGTTSDWRLNGSTAELRMPVGARVVHAELIWGGTPAGNAPAGTVGRGHGRHRTDTTGVHREHRRATGCHV